MANAVLFKMMKTNSKTSMILLISILLTHLSCATITIEITPTIVTTHDSFTISCYVSTLTQDVIFFKDNIEIGKCTPSPLPGVVPIFCVSGFSQDPTTNITKYNVTTANATIDEGTWKCAHNPETSNTLPITVFGLPSNPIDSNQAYLPNKIDATNMDSTQFTVNVSECVNPAPTISWTFYQKCDGTSINSIPITSTTSDDPDVDCSSPYSAYKNTVKVSDMKKLVDGDLCLNVRSVVGYPGTSFSNKIVTFLQNITFTSIPQKSNDFCEICCSAFALIGSAIGIVIVLIFMWKKGLKCVEIWEELTLILPISIMWDFLIPYLLCYMCLCPDIGKWNYFWIAYGLLITLVIAYNVNKYRETKQLLYLVVIVVFTLIIVIIIIILAIILWLLKNGNLIILDKHMSRSIKIGSLVIVVVFNAEKENGMWKKSSKNKKDSIFFKSGRCCRFLPPMFMISKIKKEDEGVYYLEDKDKTSERYELTINVVEEVQRKSMKPKEKDENELNHEKKSSKTNTISFPPITDKKISYHGASRLNQSTHDDPLSDQYETLENITQNSEDDEVIEMEAEGNNDASNSDTDISSSKTKKKGSKKRKGKRSQVGNTFKGN